MLAVKKKMLGIALGIVSLLTLAACTSATGPSSSVDQGSSPSSEEIPSAKATDDLLDTGVYKAVYSFQDEKGTLVHGSLVISVGSSSSTPKALTSDRSVWVFEKIQDTTIKYTGPVTFGSNGFSVTLKPKPDTVIVLQVPFKPTVQNPPVLSYKKGGVELPSSVVKETSTAKVSSFNGSYSGGGGSGQAAWLCRGSWDMLIQGTVVTGKYHGSVTAGGKRTVDTGSLSGTLSGTTITLSGTGPMGNGSGTVSPRSASGTWATTGDNAGSGTWSGDLSFAAPVAPVVVSTRVTEVTVSPSTLKLTAGGATGTLTATVAPSTASNPDVFWKSSNEAAVTVSATGVVTPVAAGTATITATTADGAKTSVCTVTVAAGSVQPGTVPVTGVAVAPASLNLVAGGATGTLTATVAPSTATNQAVTWKSSNEAAATVSATGVVTPVAAGTATITATTADGAKTSVCAVTVTATPPGAPSGVTASGNNGSCTVSWAPVPGATGYNVYWSTSSTITVTTGNKLSSVTSPYTHSGRNNGTTYYYLVTALNSGGESLASDKVSAQPKLPPPAAPTGISTYGSNNKVNITWPSVPGVSSYNLYWSTSSSVSPSSLNKLTGVTSPYTHSGRTNGTTYYYVLTSVSAGGESSASETFSESAAAPTHVITARTGGTWSNGTLKGTITINSGSPISSYTVSYGLTTLLGDALVDGNYLWRSSVLKNLSDPYTCVWLKVQVPGSSTPYYILLNPTIPSQGQSSFNVNSSPWWYELFATSYNGNKGSGYLSESAAKAAWKAGFTVVDAFLTPMP